MTFPAMGGTDSDGDGVSDYQETQIAPYHLRPHLSDLIAKPTGIEVVPKSGMDFTAALSESQASAHQDGPHGADPPPDAEQTVDQPPFGSGAIIATADPTDIAPHLVHAEADTHAVHPPHPPVTADAAKEAGPVEHDAAVEQVELVAHADQGPTVSEHLHTDTIG